jgi:beta-galactosidase
MLQVLHLLLFAAAAAFPAYPPSRGDCTLAQKLAQLSPLPFAAVIIEQPGDTLPVVAARMRQMRAEGFNAVKQILLAVPLSESAESYLNRTKLWYHAALDAGLSPWWYGEGGWECFSLQLLAQLGLSPAEPPWVLAAAPAMRAYQLALQRRRVDAMAAPPVFNLGEPGAGNPILPPALVPDFARWLNASYGGDASGLLLAWADPFRANFSAPECASFGDCAALLAAPANGWPSHDYRRYRDSMRFQADALLARLNATIAALRAADPDAPVRTGGASLQLNQAFFAWDLWAQGALARAAGSFYISSHLPWHYSGMQHEVDRPVIFEVGAAVAAGRGSWPGEWESTGGPSQYSGGQATSVTAGGITKLLLSYLAVGMKGVGLWTYNSRAKGQEMGEYALTDLRGRPTARSAAAGAIASAAGALRWELWAASEDPIVGIFYGWENEAVAARLSLQAPPFECALEDVDCRFFSAREQGAPLRARLGWARALTDAHVPFTHVDEGDVRGGALASLALRVLVLPHVLALPPDLLPAIRAWQEAGGRVVADMPWLLMAAPGGAIFDQAQGPDLFGAAVAEFHSVEAPFDGQAMALAVGANASLRVARGQFALLELTTGVARQFFEPPFEATPALVEAAVGARGGSGALINFEAGARAAQPSALRVAPTAGPAADVAATLALSAWMAGVATAGGALSPPWSASPLGVPVFLRTAVFNGTRARHVFALFDDLVAPTLCPGRSGRCLNVTLRLPWGTAAAADAVTGEQLAFEGNSTHTVLTFDVPFRSGRWVRTVDA